MLDMENFKAEELGHGDMYVSACRICMYMRVCMHVKKVLNVRTISLTIKDILPSISLVFNEQSAQLS